MATTGITNSRTGKTNETTRKHSPVWRILKWFGLTVLTVILCIILFFVFFPQTFIRGIAGQKGSAAIGRTFSIDGPLTIRWDWTTPRVHIEKIRLANAQGMDSADMLDIGSLDFSIKMWQFFYGKMNFPDLTVKDAKVTLEKQDDTHNNWTFPTLSKGNAVNTAVVPQSRYSFPVIGKLTLSNSDLIYKDAIKKLDLDLTLNTVTGSASGDDKNADEGLTVDGHGTLQDKTFVLQAKGGSVAMLRDSKQPFPLQLHLQMGGTVIDVNGTFQDPVKLEGVDTQVSIKGDNLADLFYLTSIPLPPTPVYSIDGQLKKDGDKWFYNGFKGKVGKSDLDGNLEYDASGKRGFVTMNLVSNYLDMNDMSGFIGKAPSTKNGAELGAAQKQEAAKQAASSKLLPDVPIKLNRLRATDMDVKFDAKKMYAPGYPLDRLQAHLALKGGLLTIDPLSVGVASGEVDGKLILDGRENVSSVGTDVILKQLSFHDFFKDSRFAELSSGHFGGHIDLSGKGNSLAEILSDANGRLTLTMSGGRISLLIVKAAGLDIANAATLLLGKDQSTGIRCGVGDFKVTDGRFDSQILDFDTDDSNLQGQITANLKTESLNGHIEAHPKSVSVLEPLTSIELGGTMRHPSVGVDPVEAGARGGIAAALTTVLGPLGAIIPFINLGLGKDSDCNALIHDAAVHKEPPPDTKANPDNRPAHL